MKDKLAQNLCDEFNKAYIESVKSSSAARCADAMMIARQMVCAMSDAGLIEDRYEELNKESGK